MFVLNWRCNLSKVHKNSSYGKVESARLAYVERVKKGEDVPLAEKLLQKGQLILNSCDKFLNFMTDEQAHAATYSAGSIHSDISTIPLKDIDVCPTGYFLDNYDWSNISFEDIPLREYIE